MFKYYELLEHTADLGIRVWGADIKGLFLNSALAMYELICDTASVKPVITKEIEAEGSDSDELLKNWLSELLYYFHAKDIVFGGFTIEQISDKKILSSAKGEKIDSKRHNLKHDIKAVTFHNLKIEHKEDMVSTEIIFDV